MNIEVFHQEPSTADERTADLPRLVFIHGGKGSAWVWTVNFLPWFAAHGYHVIAPSLRGHGGSEGHERLRWYSLKDYVEDVEYVVRSRVNDQPFVLIGQSMGGPVTQSYLFQADQGRVPKPAGVVFLNTTTPQGWRKVVMKPGAAFSRHPKDLFNALLHADLQHLAATPEQVRDLLFTRQTDDAVVQMCCDHLQGESLRVVLWDIMTYKIAKSAVPIRVFGSVEDKCIPPDLLKRLADAYDAPYRLFRGMGHDTMLDSRWEDVAEAIDEFASNCRKLPDATALIDESV